MHATAIFVVIISLASIGCVLFRPRGIAEAYWSCAGALLLVFSRLLPLHQAVAAVRKGLDVYLFLTGMMILAELAREEGVFDWVADLAARRSDGCPKRLFLLIYAAGVVVTVLLSNDATAVVLTPAVLAVVKRANVSPKPYLLACAFIANAASFVLPISNPANLVIFARNMPPLLQWLKIFTVPSLASIVITFVVLRWMSSTDLNSTVEKHEGKNLGAGGKLAVAGLVFASVALLLASAKGWDLGAPTCAVGALVLLVVTARDRSMPGRVIRGVSWAVIPLVAGLFVIIEALEGVGVLDIGVGALAKLSGVSRIGGNLLAAFGVGLLSNVMNNLPIGLMSGAVIHSSQQVSGFTNSVLIGVDLGPNLSVAGSLATILWLVALRREGVEISGRQFLAVGAVAMPLAMLGSVLLLGK